MVTVVVNDTLVEEVRQLLQDLKRPNELVKSDWCASCLVQSELAGSEHTIPHEALRAVLEATLGRLEEESPMLADIIRGRYWEGMSVLEMVNKQRPEAWRETQFHEHAKEARESFTRILHEQEALCEKMRQGQGKARGLSTLAIVVLAAVVVVAALMARPLAGTDVAQQANLVGGPISSPSSLVATTPLSGSILVCGEKERLTGDGPPSPPSRLIRHQGVSSFTVENTTGRVLSNFVRAVAIDSHGVFLGYHADAGGTNGLGHFNKKDWADCNSADGTVGMNVNDIAVDQKGQIWVAAEKIGVAMFDGTKWRRFTERDGLPSADTFGLTVDGKGNVWVGTWDGVGKFDGQEWSIPYNASNKTIFDNHVHAVAFDSVGNIWVGHIKAGVSLYRVADGSWVHLTKTDGQLGGDQIRAILVRPERGQHLEQVWIATSDGGVSVYERGSWKTYKADDGVPSNDVRDLAIDHYDRVWVASSGGVAYYNDKEWATYHTLDAYTVAIGPDCRGCPYDTDQVLTGTRRNGLTHSRLPLDSEGIQIVKVSYSAVVKPGQRFVPEIVVAPIAPYKLLEEKGDMLVNTDEDEAQLFGAFEHVAVKGTIEPGQAFIFSAADTPMVAPQLPDGINEQTFTSTWRVWMHTRYVGEPVHIRFTVRR